MLGSEGVRVGGLGSEGVGVGGRVGSRTTGVGVGGLKMLGSGCWARRI